MLTAVQLLAQNNFGDTRTGGLAGPMGLFLIVLLSVATVLLIRNMNARLRRLPDRFEEPTPAERRAAVDRVHDATDSTLRDKSPADVRKSPHQDRKGPSAS